MLTLFVDLFLYKALLLVDKKALKFKYNDYFVLLEIAKHILLNIRISMGY